jgi:fructokinase
MSSRGKVSKLKSAPPLVVGAGLVALDVVFGQDDGQPPRHFAGGTTGNVMACLAYLGWRSAPVSRLAPGPVADFIVKDLERWAVSSNHVSRDPTGSSPIIIQRIRRSAHGVVSHTFSWRCPSCGTHLPGYKPVLAAAAREVEKHLISPKVFFFDRVSRGTLILAQACKGLGALIVFEPSGVGEPDLFREAWRISHVVKYSHERLRDIADVDLDRSDRESLLLEVETLGSDGLRFRSHLPDEPSNAWTSVSAFRVDALRDSAGSGDWCTAGFLDKTARHGYRGFSRVTRRALGDSLRYGQALAAWNCGFEGARGGMYQVSRGRFEEQVAGILAGAGLPKDPPSANSEVLGRVIATLCPSCTEASPKANVQRRGSAPRS